MERVEWEADGLTLVGDLRVPSPAGGRAPGLVFTGPFTGVRDQVTGLYASRRAAAGYVTLAFDHGNFGESGGQPRRHEDPQGKLADLRAAVSFLRARPEVDPGRIGAVGICLGGGYALKFAAFDPRVKVFAGIAGAYNTPYAMRSGMGPHGYRQALASFAAVAEEHDQGGGVQYIPAVAVQGEAAMPGEEPFAFVVERSERVAAEDVDHLLVGAADAGIRGGFVAPERGLVQVDEAQHRSKRGDDEDERGG